MSENDGSIFKQVILAFMKIGGGLVIFVASGVFCFSVCPHLWPALNPTTHQPSPEEFAGRYVSIPAVSGTPGKNQSGSQTWLDFHRDGSIAARDHAAKTKRGKWEFPGGWWACRVKVTVAGDDSGSFESWSMGLIGERAPYVLEVRDKEGPMDFCTSPEGSPFVRARAEVYAVDDVIQGLGLISVLVLPFFLKPAKTDPDDPSKPVQYPLGGRAAKYAFLSVLGWGIWRFCYFDLKMGNDIPGIGYIIVLLVYPLIASLIFAFRCGVLRWMARRKARIIVRGNAG